MNPSDEQIKRLQFKIAEVLGWTEISDIGHGILTGFNPNNMDLGPIFLPPWTTDRNASYELIKDFTGLQAGLYLVVAPSAYDESMAYLDSEGWRWVDCDSCEGEPHGVSEDCTDCSGEGGEWVHDS